MGEIFISSLEWRLTGLVLSISVPGILLANHFQVTAMYREYYNDAILRYAFRVYIMAPLHRYLGIDFAKSILVVAEKGRRGGKAK